MEDRMDGVITASMSTLLSKGLIRLTALAAFRHSRILRSMASLNFGNRRCSSATAGKLHRRGPFPGIVQFAVGAGNAVLAVNLEKEVAQVAGALS